jgi:hypothetical protein
MLIILKNGKMFNPTEIEDVLPVETTNKANELFVDGIEVIVWQITYKTGRQIRITQEEKQEIEEASKCQN